MRKPNAAASRSPSQRPTGGHVSGAERDRRLQDLYTALAWSVSLVLHVLLLLAFARISWTQGVAGGGLEAEVVIVMAERSPLEQVEPSLRVMAAPEVSLDPGPVAESVSFEPVLEVGSTLDEAALDVLIGVELPAARAEGSSDVDWSSLGAVSGGGGDWGGLIRKLRRHGFDIVLVFDSTGSMASVIKAVKEQIHDIGTLLLEKVPGARISICTYRDEGEEYLVDGIPLTCIMHE